MTYSRIILLQIFYASEGVSAIARGHERAILFIFSVQSRLDALLWPMLLFVALWEKMQGRV